MYSVKRKTSDAGTSQKSGTTPDRHEEGIREDGYTTRPSPSRLSVSECCENIAADENIFCETDQLAFLGLKSAWQVLGTALYTKKQELYHAPQNVVGRLPTTF